MPVSKITTNFTLPDSERFVERFHSAVMSVLKIPAYDRLVILDEKLNGFFQPTNAEGRYILFEISLFEGRSADTKRALFQSVVAISKEVGVEPLNVRIVLHESHKENWGVRGGQMASDLDLGFSTTV